MGPGALSVLELIRRLVHPTRQVAIHPGGVGVHRGGQRTFLDGQLEVPLAVDVEPAALVAGQVEPGPVAVVLGPLKVARLFDLDGPLLLARDREAGIRYDEGGMEPPSSDLWG